MGSGRMQVRRGLLDRALERVAPGLAARRYAWRLALSNLERGYDGATRGRSTEGWKTPATSADAEIGAAGELLRSRMRDLVRNNAYAAQAVQVLVNNIVGTGIRPRSNSGNKALDKKVDALWDQWSRRCDAHGHTDFHGLIALAVREMIEGGDCFAIQRPQQRGDGRDVPLLIELREADHLDAGKNELRPDGSRIAQGIEYDASGRRVAYWMFEDHPGDRYPTLGRSLESRRVPVDRVAHLFERQRVQSRGAPWGVAAITDLRQLGDWRHAELMRKRTEACLVGIVTTDDETQASVAPQVVDSKNNPVEEFSPGMFAYARGGKDIKISQPTAVGGVYEWNRVQLHGIAAGFRVPYALMTGDLSQANFASSRVGLNEFRRMVEMVQWSVVIPMICEPIWQWFIAMAQLQGLLPSRSGIFAEWAPPEFESVNPLQDAQADLLETRAGFTTPAQQIAKRGYDPKQVLAEWKAWKDEADAAGLTFDSDPSRTSKGGNMQTMPPDPADDSGQQE